MTIDRTKRWWVISHRGIPIHRIFAQTSDATYYVEAMRAAAVDPKAPISIEEITQDEIARHTEAITGIDLGKTKVWVHTSKPVEPVRPLQPLTREEVIRLSRGQYIFPVIDNGGVKVLFSSIARVGLEADTISDVEMCGKACDALELHLDKVVASPHIAIWMKHLRSKLDGRGKIIAMPGSPSAQAEGRSTA